MKLLTSATLILLAGCGERDKPLPNGYRFIELSRGNGAIIKDGDLRSIRISSSIRFGALLSLGGGYAPATTLTDRHRSQPAPAILFSTPQRATSHRDCPDQAVRTAANRQIGTCRCRTIGTYATSET